MGDLIALRLARRPRFELKSLVLIEPMAFGVLDEAADKDAIDFDRAMINDFPGAVSAGNFEDGLSVFTERVSGQNWDDLTEKARAELMAVIPQIVEEAPLVSCDDLNSDDFSQISVLTFLLGTEMGPPPAAPIIERISDALPNSSRQTLSGMGHMAPVTHAGAVGDAIETFYGTLERSTGGSKDGRWFSSSLSKPATILYCCAMSRSSSGWITAYRSSKPPGARSSANCMT